MSELVGWDVPGVPVPQGSLRRGGRGQVFYANDGALMRWRELVADGCPIDAPRDGAWRCTMTFRVRRPASVRRPAPTVMPDLDKYVRAILDALTGRVWIDDGQVVWLTASKRYADDPGCSIVVSRVEE